MPVFPSRSHLNVPAGSASPGIVALSRSRARLAVGAGALAFAWAAAATGYIAFRDEVAQTVFARQTELRYAYEDRITDLKNRLEREITANLVAKRTVAERTDALAMRQAEIETRQAWLRDVVERLGLGATTGSLRQADEPPPGTPRRGAVPPSPTDAKPAPLPDDESGLRLRSSDAGRGGAAGDRLAVLDASLGRIAAASLRQTDDLRRAIHDQAARIRTALDVARIDPRRVPVREAAVGGPLVPVPATLDAGLAASVQEVETAMSELGSLAAVSQTLPLGRPLAGELEPTSGFGYRLDPFTRTAALHTGIDLRAEAGTPVRATAAGRVVAAEYVGGYGNMVEVEHESGLATRYGHLSVIGVVPGQAVSAGQILGRAGSTGRSSGTHLHYETRIRGEAVNPVRFLEAGRLLADARR